MVNKSSEALHAIRSVLLGVKYERMPSFVDHRTWRYLLCRCHLQETFQFFEQLFGIRKGDVVPIRVISDYVYRDCCHVSLRLWLFTICVDIYAGDITERQPGNPRGGDGSTYLSPSTAACRAGWLSKREIRATAPGAGFSPRHGRRITIKTGAALLNEPLSV